MSSSKWFLCATAICAAVIGCIGDVQESGGKSRRWLYFQYNSEYASSLDTRSITKINGTDTIEAWVQRIWNKPQHLQANTNFVRSMEMYKVHCKSRRIRSLSNKLYDETGVVQDQDRPPSRMEAVIPQSIGENIFETICFFDEDPVKARKDLHAVSRRGEAVAKARDAVERYKAYSLPLESLPPGGVFPEGLYDHKKSK